MTTEAADGARCAWCGTVAAPGATNCASCGAALAQREEIGDVLIPGVTGIAPALQAAADRPMHVRGSSPAQGMAGGMAIAAAMGGPVGLAAVGGFAAVAAAEYVGARRTGDPDVPDAEHLGTLSEVARQALERVEREEAAAAGHIEAPPAPVADPWRDEPNAAADATAEQATPEDQSPADPWRDLPEADPSHPADPWRDLPQPNGPPAEASDPWRDLPPSADPG